MRNFDYGGNEAVQESKKGGERDASVSLSSPERSRIRKSVEGISMLASTEASKASKTRRGTSYGSPASSPEKTTRRGTSYGGSPVSARQSKKQKVNSEKSLGDDGTLRQYQEPRLEASRGSTGSTSFLKWDIKGQLLAAVGRDGDNRIVPIAWAVVEIENDTNWDWFVKRLALDLGLEDGNGFVIMSDKQKFIPSFQKLSIDSVVAIYTRTGGKVEKI
ncbi:hypothetical protein YC2023_057653 [Brassica napus]